MTRSVALLFLLALSACGSSPTVRDDDKRIPFTSALRSEWNFSDDELKSLQYYIHTTVVLSRAVSDGSRSIAKGKLVLRSGQYIDEIELPGGTPGIATAASDFSLQLCFEKDCGATLRFGCRDGCGSWAGKYNSMAKSWEKGVGQVDYAGLTYSMTPSTYIEIDKDALAKVQRNRRVLPGKRIDDKK